MENNLLERVREIENLNLNEKIEVVKELYNKAKRTDWDKNKDKNLMSITFNVLDYEITLYATYCVMLDSLLSYSECKLFCKNLVCVEIQKIKRKEQEQDSRLALLNTSICTNAGTYRLVDLTLEEAQELIVENKDNLLSAIGHASTAQIMTELLDTEIEVNRIQFSQQENQKALVFKMLGRPEEGKILTKEEIEEMGYKFQLLERIA